MLELPPQNDNSSIHKILRIHPKTSDFMRFVANPEDLSMIRICTKILTCGFLAERLLRQFKRKMKQAMTFRSYESLEYFCTTLGLLGMLRRNGENLFESVAKKFG
jgi:hypothetical protein